MEKKIKKSKNHDGFSKHEIAKKNFMNKKKDKGNKGNFRWNEEY